MITNYQAGHSAEVKASDYLKRDKFEIVELNWKTKFCEIDILAKKLNVIYFVEVKYRKTSHQGSSLEYITPKKLKQMQFAAEMWVHNNKWTGEYQLAAIGIDGDTITFLTEL